MKAIFIDCNEQLAPVWQRVLRPDDPPIDVIREAFRRDELPRVLNGYDIALDDHSYMPTDLVAKSPQLKHIVFLGTGAASYMDIGELDGRGIKVHTIKGYGDTAVAEHTIALLMACARNVATMDRAIRSGTWETLEGRQLSGRTLGLIGLGGIGREVARIAAGIGLSVIAWNRSPLADAPVPLVELDALLARADIVSLHLALNDATRGFLDDARLARLKRGCILINTARGALVDEAALLRHLATGQIAQAGLDVFATEPLSADHPLAQRDNVTLTAHAGFCTEDATLELLRRAVAIVRQLT
jgi:D-3-phosphoglycerate dehydrogenase